ncbi:conjugative transposon protein TraN [Mucilaginibacter sp. PAMB04274]|uniref:conjugative transposon protein TraN n=1 Tax=Mucilaginibacter sp. PAMB04274 TaxID=3138568 RepID=UPI0031F71BD4
MQKLRFLLAVILVTAGHAFAQSVSTSGFEKAALPVIYLPEDLSVHFVSPEPIQYVDISTKAVIGDLPVKNILRLRRRADSLRTASLAVDAVLTIVGEKFIAQYRLVFAAEGTSLPVRSDIEILPADTRPLDYPGTNLSRPQLQQYSVALLGQKPDKHLEHSKAYGLRANLGHVYTLGDYIFLDISFENETRLKYDIDELRFKIEDKKVTKATTIQTLEIKPDFVLFDISFFKKHYRNIFVFKKFTFPGNKLLTVELSEKQLSGRTITLKVPYQDILDADIIPVP